MKPKEGYAGVKWDSSKQNWRAWLTFKGVNYLDTRVSSEREGVIMRDTIILKKHLKVKVQILTPRIQ